MWSANHSKFHRDLWRSVCMCVFVCARSSTALLTHGCVAALQERFGVPQEQPVVWIHYVGLPLGHGESIGLLLFLFFILILVFVRAVELLIPVVPLLQQRLLQGHRGLNTETFALSAASTTQEAGYSTQHEKCSLVSPTWENNQAGGFRDKKD